MIKNTLRKLSLILLVLVSVVLLHPTGAQAQECTNNNVGECIRGFECYCDHNGCYRHPELPCGGELGSDVIGDVHPPPAVTNWAADSPTTFGGIAFLSIVIRLITIVAGIFVMLNFVAAGAKYIFSMGNTQANVEVRDKLLFSVIGLLIIVAAYTIAGIIGLIFFGDAGFILRPTIMGALQLAP